MLDMVTDRCCSACLFALLVSVYDGPASFAFQMLIALDLASHYCHVYSQLLSGTSSHKKMDADENWILKIYYGSQKVFDSPAMFCSMPYLDPPGHQP
jgi:CDP-diacylglycerol--inositol 3-phosphatidyltransferase